MKLQVARVGVPLLLLVLTVAYLGTAYATLEGMSRRLPLLAAYATIFLLLVELLRCWIQEPGPESKRKRDAAIGVCVSREIYGLSCVIGCLMGIYFVGFYVAIPAYILVSIALLGKQSPVTAVLASLMTSLSIYVVFDVLLGYQLFAGVLLS